MKHEKKYEIMGLLDDRIYEEVLQKREKLTRGGVHRTGNRLRRMLLIAACVALLAVGVTAAFLPAMLSDPGVDTPPTAESESAATPFPDAEWVEDPTIVQVQRLSVGGNFDTASIPTAKDDTVTVETEQRLGERLILLQFRCREGERITVTPDGGGALFETVQIEYNQYPCWSVWNPEKEEYYLADEYLKVNTEEKRAFLGRSVTITKDTVLVWQYPDLPRPCREDNFVDFTVTDSEGRITGGGSIYIGGLDLTTVSENKTYYGGGAGITDVYLNASYRPVLLGAYRYTEGSEVDTDTHAAKLAALHSEAESARQGLFDDLSEDYFKLSYRILLLRYKTDRFYGIYRFTIHHDVSYDRYTCVELWSEDEKQSFFLYDGICQPITEWEIFTADEYGRTVTGKLTLEDGTVVLVDINHPEQMYTFIPPTE